MELNSLPFGVFDVKTLAILETLSKELSDKVQIERVRSKDFSLFKLIQDDPTVINKMYYKTLMRMCCRLTNHTSLAFLVYPEIELKAFGVHYKTDVGSYFFSNIKRKLRIPRSVCTHQKAEDMYSALNEFLYIESVTSITQFLKGRSNYTTKGIHLRTAIEILAIDNETTCVHRYTFNVCDNPIINEHHSIDKYVLKCYLESLLN
jgi:hypothetical protein